MFYLYALIMIVSGLALAWFGQKKYGLSFATTYLVTSLVSYFMLTCEINSYPYLSVFLGVTLAITLGIWFFAKAFTYILAWEIIFILLLGFNLKVSGGGPNPILGLITLILPIVIVYFIRKIITKVTLGFFSGFNIAFGILSIILIEKFKSGAIFSDQPTYIFIVLLVCLAGGVYFQFSPYANNKTTTE